MNIYIMRHGTTVWNEQHRTQGRSQNRLSQAGRELAKSAAEKLKNIKLDIIYSSPLMRTMQTANIVNIYHNCKIVRNELLTEIGQGIFTGKFWDSLSESEKLAKRNRDKSCKMEQYDEAFARAKKFVDEVLKKETHENILIVSHNNSCSFLENILTETEVDFSNYAKINSFDNAEIKKFKL